MSLGRSFKNFLLSIFSISKSRKSLNYHILSKDVVMGTSIILLEMSGRDGDYDPVEIQRIYALMSEHLYLEGMEARDLLEKASKLKDDAKQKSILFKTLQSGLSEHQKMILLSLAWEILLADGQIEKEEMRYIHQLKSRLQVDDTIVQKARTLAESRKV